MADAHNTAAHGAAASSSQEARSVAARTKNPALKLSIDDLCAATISWKQNVPLVRRPGGQQSTHRVWLQVSARSVGLDPRPAPPPPPPPPHPIETATTATATHGTPRLQGWIMGGVGPDGGDQWRLAAAVDDGAAALPVDPAHSSAVAKHAGKYCLVIANIFPKDNNQVHSDGSDRSLVPNQVVELADWRRRQKLWLAEVAQAQALDAPKPGPGGTAAHAPKASSSLALTPPDFLDD